MDAAYDLDAAARAFASQATGADLPPEVEALIRRAGLVRDQEAQALELLEQARERAPSHPVPLIALYRFHFYGHRLDQARTVAVQALELARGALGPGLSERQPDAEAARADAALRFYLFTLKGLAYLNLRQGDVAPARAALTELNRLDPNDEVGAALLQHVLARAERGDSQQDEEGAPYPARGWGAA